MPRLITRFIQKPLQIGSIAASSHWLADRMAAQADLRGRVLELGAGTGPITERLLSEVHPSRLEIVESDPDLASHLRKRFPHVRLHTEDAEEVLTQRSCRFRSVISGIPFAVMEKQKRIRLFRLIRERLESDGKFVMFQYSKTTKNELRSIFGDEAVTSSFVPLNIPPAFVFVCRASHDKMQA